LKEYKIIVMKNRCIKIKNCIMILKQHKQQNFSI
jgi:hypothetical protein